MNNQDIINKLSSYAELLKGVIIPRKEELGETVNRVRLNMTARHNIPATEKILFKLAITMILSQLVDKHLEIESKIKIENAREIDLLKKICDKFKDFVATKMFAEEPYKNIENGTVNFSELGGGANITFKVAGKDKNTREPISYSLKVEKVGKSEYNYPLLKIETDSTIKRHSTTNYFEMKGVTIPLYSLGFNSIKSHYNSHTNFSTAFTEMKDTDFSKPYTQALEIEIENSDGEKIAKIINPASKMDVLAILLLKARLEKDSIEAKIDYKEDKDKNHQDKFVSPNGNPFKLEGKEKYNFDFLKIKTIKINTAEFQTIYDKSFTIKVGKANVLIYSIKL